MSRLRRGEPDTEHAGRTSVTFGAAVAPDNLRRLFTDPSFLLGKAVLLGGISYLFLPIDLVPDRLGLVGHVDEASFLLAGLGGGLVLSLPRPRQPGIPNRGGRVRKLSRRLAWRFGETAATGTIGRISLRLMLGRWPDAEELRHFRDGFAANAHGLPPLLRAAAYVPAARPMLNRTMLLSAQRAGDDAPLGAAQLMGDPMRFWQGPPVRFLHLEKTAGSSLINALTAQFHPLQIDPDPDRNTPPHQRQPFPAATRGAQRAAALVWGHYDLPSLRRLDDGAPSFTLCVFREPKQRILSLYYYWRANTEDRAPTVRAAHDNGLLAFLRTRNPLVLNYIDNLYVRRLTGTYAIPAGDGLAEAPDRLLQDTLLAVDGLDQVGLTSQLGDFLSRLGHRLGFTPPRHTPQVNVLARSEQNAFLPYKPTVREPITPEIERELDRLTRLDRLVYEHVGARLRRERAATTGSNRTAAA